jgi:hypothetical protein
MRITWNNCTRCYILYRWRDATLGGMTRLCCIRAHHTTHTHTHYTVHTTHTHTPYTTHTLHHTHTTPIEYTSLRKHQTRQTHIKHTTRHSRSCGPVYHPLTPSIFFAFISHHNFFVPSFSFSLFCHHFPFSSNILCRLHDLLWQN